MLERVSSYIQSYFIPQAPSSGSLPSASSSPYTSSFSSITGKKSNGLIAGFLIITFIYLWKSKWNPLKGLFGSTTVIKSVPRGNESIGETEIKCPIARETYKACKQKGYFNIYHNYFRLRSGEELLAQSQFFSNTNQVITPGKLFDKTAIQVVHHDCLDAAQKEKEYGGKVAVLMFASPLEAGGGMTDGNIGQEEDLCRRSDIFDLMWDQVHQVASRQLYPLVSLVRADQIDPQYNEMEYNGMIHVPQVTVFRAGKTQNYAFLETPFEVGMLISPAPNKPKLNVIAGVIDYALDEDRNQMRKLITTQLSIACMHGYDTVILGAFGCGAFCNPPQAVADLYQIIIDNSFKGAFKKIVFAILDDRKGRHNPTGNLKPFQDCFPIMQRTN